MYGLVGYQNELLRAVTQTVYIGDLDCLQRRLRDISQFLPTINYCSDHEKIHPYLVQIQGLCSGIFVNGDLQRLKIGMYCP